MATAELRRRLVQLDAQIVEQRAILDALERTRLDVDRELRATATFPVVELPVEVTAKIFHSCFQNFSRNPNRRRYDYAWHGITRFAGIMRLVPHTPLVLASVCQRWRAIALSTPELWSQMEYSFPEAGMSSKFSSEVETREATEKITRWLDRAGSRPLSIHRRAGQNVVCNNVIPDSSHTPNRVRELINAHSDKVQHLELDMPESVIRQLGLDCRWFPLLKSVSLGVSSSDGSSWDDSDEPDETELHIFANAPLLHKLRNYRPLLSWVILPWLRLTKFDGLIYAMDLFTLTPNLTEAICTVDYDEEPISVIIHLCLQSLTLVAPYFGSHKDILCHLTLPALQSLHISKMEDTTYSSLHPFLSRSSPPLLALSIGLADDRFQYLMACFQHISPTLETLTLGSPSVAARQVLYHFGFPHLRTLNFLESPGIDHTELLQFLYERPNIRSFGLSCTAGTFLDNPTDVGEFGEYGSRRYGSKYGCKKVEDHFTTLAARGMTVKISSTCKTYLDLIGSNPVL